MSNRSASPDAAFAYVGKFGASTFKLLRHHTLDAVKDGNEHDTVDPRLLDACMRMIDQVPVTTEEREKIRAHLQAHANFLLNLKDPKMAEKIVNQQVGGSPEKANKDLTEKAEIKLADDLKPNPESTSAGVVVDDGDKPVGGPNISDTPGANPAGNDGEGKQIKTDDNVIEKGSPNTDKFGKASLNETEEDLKKKINDAVEKIKLAIAGKLSAKLHSAQKVGSVEMMELKIGDDEQYPYFVMMEVARDSEGGVRGIKLWNESLPGEVLADFAKFLSGLAKEVSKTDKVAMANTTELATAPAILERCVSKVLTQKVADYKEKNGKAPDAKTRKKMESSAFAICNSSLKKAGKI